MTKIRRIKISGGWHCFLITTKNEDDLNKCYLLVSEYISSQTERKFSEQRIREMAHEFRKEKIDFVHLSGAVPMFFEGTSESVFRICIGRSIGGTAHINLLRKLLNE